LIWKENRKLEKKKSGHAGEKKEHKRLCLLSFDFLSSRRVKRSIWRSISLSATVLYRHRRCHFRWWLFDRHLSVDYRQTITTHTHFSC